MTGCSGVQVQLVATYAAFGAGFEAIADGLAVVQGYGYIQLLVAARNDTRIASLTLTEGATTAAPAPGDPQIGTASGADFALQDNLAADRIYVFSSHDGLLRHANVGWNGVPGTTNGSMTDQGYLYGVTAMEIIEAGPTDIAAIAQRNVPGLRLFSINE